MRGYSGRQISERVGAFLRSEAALLVAVLVVVLGAWSFVELADEVVEGSAQQIDEWVVLHLRESGDLEQTIGPDWVEEVAENVTALGGWPVLLLVILGASGYLLLAGKLRAMWLVIVATLSGWGLSSLMKELFSRERPDVVPHLVEVETLSFPSGHAMMSAVTYLTLGVLLAQVMHGWRLRIYLMAWAMVLTLLVGLSRVVLGVHYPTDVLAGWSAGLVWAMVCWLVVRWLQRRGAVEQPSEVTEDLSKKRPSRGSA